jgi:hypothetical protein
MAQLSRPYQIGLVAVALLAAAWLLVLGGHHKSASESTSSPPPSASAHTVKAPAAPAHARAQDSAGQATGHGSASSLGALGHDVEKARGAVATSKQNAKELEAKSGGASSPNTSSSSKTAAPGAAHANSAAPGASASTGATIHAPAKSPTVRAGTLRAAVAPRQHLVEAQLAQGRTVLIFFWNPKGSDDRSVNQALGRLPHGLHISVDRARANAVATFGTITRGVQVYGTPTLLVLNAKGQVTTLTGLQDTYTIAQAIREAKKS